MSASASNGSAGRAAAKAVLVADGWAEGAHYPMYDVQVLEAGGAQLTGDILLEENEQMLLEITFPDGATLRARAQVVAVDRNEGGLRVEFTELDAGARALIASHATKG